MLPSNVDCSLVFIAALCFSSELSDVIWCLYLSNDRFNGMYSLTNEALSIPCGWLQQGEAALLTHVHVSLMMSMYYQENTTSFV